MPDAGKRESTHQPRQPPELRWLEEHYARQRGDHTKEDRGSVGELLQRIVSRVNRGFEAEEEVVPRHRQNALDIARREQHLAPMAARKLIDHVQDPATNEDPHESEVPLECAAKPASNRDLPGDADQVLLRDLCAKAGKGTKDLQA